MRVRPFWQLGEVIIAWRRNSQTDTQFGFCRIAKYRGKVEDLEE